MIPDIYYNIYNRGAHKADIFLDGNDYVRMLKLMFIANNNEPFNLSKMRNDLFTLDRKEMFVEIVAYCLMPNHIHIAIKKPPPNKPDQFDKVSCFMHKLATGYSVYFNNKYSHSGTIWQGSYKEKIAYDGLYIRTLINYIHLNPCSLREGDARNTEAENAATRLEFAMNYEYSSIKDYTGIVRPQKSILSSAEMARFQSKV